MRVLVVGALLSMVLSAAVCISTIFAPGRLGSLVGIEHAEGVESLETWIAIGVSAIASLFTSMVIMAIHKRGW